MYQPVTGGVRRQGSCTSNTGVSSDSDGLSWLLKFAMCNSLFHIGLDLSIQPETLRSFFCKLSCIQPLQDKQNGSSTIGALHNNDAWLPLSGCCFYRLEMHRDGLLPAHVQLPNELFGSVWKTPSAPSVAPANAQVSLVNVNDSSRSVILQLG